MKLDKRRVREENERGEQTWAILISEIVGKSLTQVTYACFERMTCTTNMSPLTISLIAQ